jgi:hypothetical protein
MTPVTPGTPNWLGKRIIKSPGVMPGFLVDGVGKQVVQGSAGQKKTLETTKLPWSSEHSEESCRLTSGLGNDPTIVLTSMLTFGYRGMFV